MEPRCSLCGKTVKQMAVEQLSESYSARSISIELSDKLAYPYLLCNVCEELLRATVSATLVELKILEWDEAKDKYILTTE